MFQRAHPAQGILPSWMGRGVPPGREYQLESFPQVSKPPGFTLLTPPEKAYMGADRHLQGVCAPPEAG